MSDFSVYATVHQELLRALRAYVALERKSHLTPDGVTMIMLCSAMEAMLIKMIPEEGETGGKKRKAGRTKK